MLETLSKYLLDSFLPCVLLGKRLSVPGVCAPLFSTLVIYRIHSKYQLVYNMINIGSINLGRGLENKFLYKIIANSVFVGNKSDSAAATMYKLKGQSSNMRTGPSSWSFQLVLPAGPSSWSLQQECPAGLSSRPV